VLGFNLGLTGWIGEWRLLVIGLGVHAAVGLVLGVCLYSGAGVARATSRGRYRRGDEAPLREL
jgi:hypothetical protein